jgi:peptidoglycan/xylan/chitin deacetylase (PgdA/CDA1 family)
MRVISILYHDVICNGEFDASGFPGAGAGVYKLERSDFQKHLLNIAESISAPPAAVFELLEGSKLSVPFLMTFDDGGASAISPIADQLEAHGWIGHFLITASRIGSCGFLTREQVRDLHKRGHVIGSHSHSHPARMSSCNWETLVKEWSTSVQLLSDVLGERVRVASIPGGYYSRSVAKAASVVGIRALFTSEPTSRSWLVDDCVVLGRFTVRRDTPARVAAGYASGQLAPCLRQWLLWNLMKIPKGLGGERYVKIREAWLS